MSDTLVESIVMKCVCGTSMRVRAGAAGKKAKCPTCRGVMTIPGTPMGAPGVAMDAPAGPSDLTDLISMEPSAAPETATTAQTAEGSPVTVAGAAGSLGTFALGTTFSAVGAAIGGVVWYLVVRYANYEVGYIAWGLGVLAGLGMVYGHKAHTVKAGVTAAAISALGIVGAKLAIFIPFFTAEIGPTDESGREKQAEFVASFIADDILDKRGVTDEKEIEAQWDSAYEEATLRVKKMSDDEIRAACKEYRQQFEEAIGRNEPFMSAFVQNEFSPFDLLWFFLALSSAFKIGRGATVAQT